MSELFKVLFLTFFFPLSPISVSVSSRDGAMGLNWMPGHLGTLGTCSLALYPSCPDSASGWGRKPLLCRWGYREELALTPDVVLFIPLQLSLSSDAPLGLRDEVEDRIGYAVRSIIEAHYICSYSSLCLIFKS